MRSADIRTSISADPLRWRIDVLIQAPWNLSPYVTGLTSGRNEVETCGPPPGAYPAAWTANSQRHRRAMTTGAHVGRCARD